MGYFSNGTEGDAYEAKYCAHCVHEKPGCAVMAAHLLFGYGQSGELAQALSELIPRSHDGLSNLKCRMFISIDEVKRKRRERKNEAQGGLFG